jgi:hypothetical protein
MVTPKLSNVMVVGIVSALLANGCSTETHGIARRIHESCDRDSSEAGYFLDLFSREDDSTEARARDVWKLLVKLNEPPIACAGTAKEVYRMLYMPERARPFSIRAERVTSNYSVTVSREAGDGDSPRGTTRRLTAADWDSLTRAIDSYNYWSRPPHPTPTTMSHDVIVVHGPAWLLEGRENGWYHAVSRVSASKEPAFDAPVRTLFELAQLDVPQIIRRRP